MGLQKESNEGTFLNVSNGRLVKVHAAANSNTVERVNKLGKTVYEEAFNSLTGILTGMSKRENEYGVQWMVYVADGEDKFIITVSDNSRYLTSLMKVLPNLDLNKKVKISPWSMIDKSDPTKKVTGISCYQGDDVACTVNVAKVDAAYTKEKPDGLPQMKQVKISGKMVWDSTDMNAFLEAKALSIFEGLKKDQPVEKTSEPVAEEKAFF